MRTSTDAPARSVPIPAVTVLRGLWVSWWDGAWLWIAVSIVVGIILAPLYVLYLVLPESVTRVVGPGIFVLVLFAAPVIASRLFRALDNTRPWDRLGRKGS